METSRSTALDELLQNPRRLMILHVVLGVAAALLLWIRPGTFTPSLRGLGFRDASPILQTAIAWWPYALSYLYTKSILSNRSRVAVYCYAAVAAAVTAISGGLYLSGLGHQPSDARPAWLVSLGVAIALLLAGYVCGSIWRAHTADERVSF